jgi:multidrug efflux pump subunit AcrB
MNAYFTATSLVGFIALAGGMVRNSILLIDFINIRLREGVLLRQAIIEAGAVRTTPILLTAGAVAIGAFIILIDLFSRVWPSHLLEELFLQLF